MTMMTIPKYRCMSYHFLRNWSILRMSEGPSSTTPVTSVTQRWHTSVLWGTPAWSILGKSNPEIEKRTDKTPPISRTHIEYSHPKWLRLQTKYLNTCLIFFIRLYDIWFCYSMMSWTWEHSTTIQGHPQMGFPDRFTLCGVATAAMALFRPRAEPLPLAETGGCEIIIPKWPLQ